MTATTQHRRLRDSRGGVLRAVGVGATLAGVLAGTLGLQVAGDRLQARLGKLVGRPSSGASFAATGIACPTAASTGSAAVPCAGNALASWHAGVMPAI